MIYFVSCNRDQNILLGEDRSLYTVLRADKDVKFFNLLGYYSIGVPLMNLFPPQELCYADESTFRYRYSANLQMNPNMFFDLMTLMMETYFGNKVVVVTDLDHPIAATVVDCVMDWFYQRYGFQCSIISTLEDMLYVKDGEISMDKIDAFTQDKEYYTRNSIDPTRLLNKETER